MLKKIAGLGLCRIAALALVFLQNVLIVRFLPLGEIGLYYLIATAAYLGNASVFVGADFCLQMRLSDLPLNRSCSFRGIAQYISVVGMVGGGGVLATSVIYFYLTGKADWTELSLICSFLSVATFASGLGRNLLQLANLPEKSNIGLLCEGGMRVLLIVGMWKFGAISALGVAVASILGSFISACAAFLLLKMSCAKREESYLRDPVVLVKRIFAVGLSGVMNWGQVQGYRPLFSALPGGAAVVGTIAFMSALGSTAANAVYSILAQVEVPKQYESQGKSTSRYLRVLMLVALSLSVLSIPAGVAFLWMTGKCSIMPYVFLVGVGVLVEAGNAIVGICTNHANALKSSLRFLPYAGFFGLLVTLCALMTPIISDLHLRVAFALLLGQLAAVGVSLYSFAMPKVSV